MTTVYADYAAATPTDPRVIERVAQVSQEITGNPSSRHSFGRKADGYLTQARSEVASFIGAQAEEIYFTASGTESNNLAILGFAKANRARGDHIVTSSIEHPSVLNACRALERDGFEVTYLAVDSNGHVLPEDFEKSLTAKTILASIHFANSEIGVVQDIAALAAIARRRDVAFHTDACQAAAFLGLEVEKLGVDLLTFNGSKLYGPRGTAVLYVRDTVSIFPLVYGGGQEGSLRSGTENLPGIVGLAEACQIVSEKRDGDYQRIESLRDELQLQLTELGCTVNVAASNRLPNHLSVVIPTDCTDVVAVLDEKGVALSSGSACSSGAETDSHVLLALGLTSEQINRTVRITLGRQNKKADIAAITTAVSEIVKRPRQ